MRNNGIFVILALAFAITISAVGDAPSIDLPVEPIVTPQEPTLAEAALRNDFATFDSLYKAAEARGENVTAWRDLHNLWTWSMTDPVGGFYGRETHDRFARAYPNYARFIEDHRIVDANGNVFYPSAETRAFLLSHVHERGTAAFQAAVPPASSRPEAGVTAGKMPAVREPAPAPPVVIASPVQQPAPAKVAAVAPAPAERPRPVEPAARPGIGRGIFLIIVGLIGVGVLTVMLHAPAEEPHSQPHG